MFPAWAQTALNWSPFPYLFYFPVKVLQSPEWTPALTRSLGIGMVYAVLGVILMFTIYRIGIKSYEVVGN